ncbi:hypothetical protein WA026_009400 [Henosepilachna vigintioctopunctata]|uniref:Alpha-and gamma-adaptin-binding protein p34 n=1 Tax=Henosepilachna vigintioctopunctata TaxID=420089 RepID=A0AAW1U5R4_9CUCU
MDSKPSVLVLSSTTTKPKSLIKLITKTNSIIEEVSGIVKQNWNIVTKYYTAEINFIGLENDFERNEEFNNNVEGLIIHLDTNKSTGLGDLKIWENIENDCDADIKLLIANYCNDETKICRTKAVEWCIKRGFEFIELYPSQSDNPEQESEFQEKVGVDRIIEALHSHTWSNLDLKSPQKIKVLKNSVSEKHEKMQKVDNVESDNIEDSLDDFTELFSQLHTMRESLSSLPANQRKQCAEQMVTAFWKAIGGDEEEVADL